MNSFGEIRTCLIVMFSAMLIIKTRARFIYQPDTVVHCLEAKVPCSGHRSEDSCKEYCQANGFIEGRCDASCCMCYATNNGHSQPSTSTTTPDSTSDDILAIHSIDDIFATSSSIHRPTIIRNPSNRQSIVPNHPQDDKRSLNSNGILVVTSSTHSISQHVNVTPTPSPSNQGDIKYYEDEDNSLENEIESSICLTPSCVKTANNLLVNMNPSIDPCTDFYEFACGNFEREAIIPDDKPSVTPIGSMTDKLHHQIRRLIEESSAGTRSSRLVKNLYDSCMDIEGIEGRGTDALKGILRTLGGWPLLQQGTEVDKNLEWKWTDVAVKQLNLGIGSNFLLGLQLGANIKEPTKRIITIGEPSLSFGRERLSDSMFMKAYQKYQLDLAVFLGANRSSSVVIQQLDHVLQFEMALANISLPRELLRQHPLAFYNPISISELQSKFSSINWIDFIRNSFPSSIHISEEEIVSLMIPQHLQNLFRLIEMTDKRTIANYLMWRTASSLIVYTNESGKKLMIDFSGKITGQKVKPPQWRECVALVTKTLAHAVGKMYVEKHFQESDRQQAKRMFQDIHSAFYEVLDQTEWMDPQTKKMAHAKAMKMRSHVGYPEELLDEDKLNVLYSQLELSRGDFFGNILNISKSATEYSLKKLRQLVDPNDWVNHGKPAVVNAFYNPQNNFIQFPSGILQGHFFGSQRPEFMNYGAIGWVYGHELIHGFDDQGSHFDLNGDLKDWWHPLTKQSYQHKTQCIVEQYSKFNVTSNDLVHNKTITKLNGIISQGENIADNGGLKLAYMGYQSWVKRHGQEKKLPGLLDYTPNQLFWLSSANNWCSKYRNEVLKEKLKSSVHPPGKFRVLGSFSNSRDFAKDFNCPVGAPMNPVDKCTVW